MTAHLRHPAWSTPRFTRKCSSIILISRVPVPPQTAYIEPRPSSCFSFLDFFSPFLWALHSLLSCLCPLLSTMDVAAHSPSHPRIPQSRCCCTYHTFIYYMMPVPDLHLKSNHEANPDWTQADTANFAGERSAWLVHP